MPTYLKILFFLLAAHVLGGCAGLKEAREARRVANAEKVLADHKRNTPPDKQLSDLVLAHPELEGKTVRVVTKRDTVVLPAVTADAVLPQVSTPAGDKALIDSLIASAGLQLHAIDSTLFAARLRAELAARPRLSRDTVTRHIGPITLKLWTDAHGRPQATVVKVEQKVGYEKEVHENGPIVVQKELAWWERFQLFIKDAAGIIIAMLVLIGGIWLWFYIQRQREKQPADEPLPF
jgi:hypothetical protein